jgi:chromosome segregation ATPase
MTEESLRAHLARLRSELAAAHDLDRDTREELQQLARAVETALEHPASAGTIRERLADRIRELEVSHPRLSSTIGNLVDTLAFYGI